MTPTRVLIGLLGGLAVLSLLALLTQVIAPEPARAYWDPPPIAKGGGPGDPGTPYEEPEGGTPTEDPGGSKPPEGAHGPGEPPAVSPAAPSSPAPPQPDTQWLFLILQAWRIHLLFLVRS
jgi:hypothetical protein